MWAIFDCLDFKGVYYEMGIYLLMFEVVFKNQVFLFLS